MSVVPFSLRFDRHFSRWTWVSRWISLLRLIEVVSGDNWSYQTCKAPVKLSPPTNQHSSLYRPDPFLSPNQQCQSTFTVNNNIVLLFPRLSIACMLVVLTWQIEVLLLLLGACGITADAGISFRFVY